MTHWRDDPSRRYVRPDARHTPGLTDDDIAPTPWDDRELRRHCKAQNVPWETAYEAGKASRPNPFPDDRDLTDTWWLGIRHRNRDRQDVWVAWLRARRRQRRRRH